MPRTDAQASIVRHALAGVYCAAEEWEEMSGEWLWTAPEYFTSTVVAQHLSRNLENSWITLEWGTKGTLAAARSVPKPGRAHKSLDGSKRFDLVVFYGSSERPRAAIEVKTRVATFETSLAKDFDRLLTSVSEVHRGSCLSLGLQLVYLESGPIGRGKKTPIMQVESWSNEIQHLAKKRFDTVRHRHPSVSLEMTRGQVKHPENPNAGAFMAMAISLANARPRSAVTSTPEPGVPPAE